MIYRVFIVFTILIALTSCNKKQNIIIRGELENGKTEMVWLDRLNVNITVAVDSQLINNKNQFRFKRKAEHPDIYMIRNKQGRFISLLAHPGEKIDISGDYYSLVNNYSISGSPESEKIKTLVNHLEQTKSRLKELDSSVEDINAISETQALEYINLRKEIIKEQRDFSIGFIMRNLNSLASIFAIYQTYGRDHFVLGESLDLQYMKILADTLSQNYPDIPLVTSFVNDARASERRYYNLLGLSEVMRDAETGMPDLSIPSVKGDTVKLSSLKGKIVLLYFWSSLSRPSREQNISLLEIYKKYRNKGFEIYAVSLDNNKEAWEKAVWMDELNWINVCELTYPDSRASVIYNISKLPTTYLLNRDGEILARDLYGKELEKWLDNLLN
jgi:thiol-disulfide isomerase/thioredoxin